MVKKLKKMAESKAASPAGLLDSQLAHSVKAQAQQIWLAGMGAFAKAQGEGGKVFEALIKEGVSLQRKTQAVAEERLTEVTGKMSAMAELTARVDALATAVAKLGGKPVAAAKTPAKAPAKRAAAKTAAKPAAKKAVARKAPAKKAAV